MDKKILKGFDIPLFINVIFLVLLDFAIYAATQSFSQEMSTRFVIIQAVAFVLGLIAMGVVISIDYNQFGVFWKVIYGISILMLIAVLIPGIGKVNKGLEAGSVWALLRCSLLNLRRLVS